MSVSELFKKTFNRCASIHCNIFNKSAQRYKKNIAFIVIGEESHLVDVTINSIKVSEKAGSFPEHCIVIMDVNQVVNDCNIVEKNDIFKSLGNVYIKIIAAGDILNDKFLAEFYRHVDFNAADDIILHAYSVGQQALKIEPTLANLKNITDDKSILKKEYALPYINNCIFKARLLFPVMNSVVQCSFSQHIIFMLAMMARSTPQAGYQFLNNAYVSTLSSERFEIKMQQLVKSGVTLINLLQEISNNAKLMLQDTTKLKGILFLVHQMVLILLKNKKADETLTAEEQEIAQSLLIEITHAIGHKTIKSFSSPGYNHIHKIGYSQITGLHAERDICYLEESDHSEQSLKFKIASHTQSYPRCYIDNQEIMPQHVKIKQLTLFNLAFSFEAYLWISFKNSEQKISFNNYFPTDLFVSGKRVKAESYENLLSVIENKKRVKEKLPFKAKVLRQIAAFKLVKTRFAECWLLVDNDLRADDNAEHFYRYLKKNKPEVNAWFLLNQSSPDWVRLKTEGFKLIKFGSLRHRVALLNAKFLLSSHANPAITNFLPRKHYCDMMQFKFVFLQHGVTKDDQSEWLNSRKIDYLVTAGTPEFHDIADNGRYRYTSKETVLTGFPRYDNLSKTETYKQILIMPTWRKSLSGELMSKSSKRIKNPDFLTSLFCEQWGGFLKSAELKKMAKKRGYKILFLAHPNLVDYLEELAIPDYIEIGSMDKCSIQTVFKQSDVLITDYSSVAFDVAYMRKSIIYFHFDIDTFFSEHSYSKGYFDYENHGFGPIAKDITSLQHKLNDTLKKKCQLDSYYAKRINDFFPYADNDNATRLFNVLTTQQPRARTFELIKSYFQQQLKELDLVAAEKSLVTLSDAGFVLTSSQKKHLADNISEMIFWAKLQNRHVLLAKLITHADKFKIDVAILNNNKGSENNPLASALQAAVALNECHAIKPLAAYPSLTAIRAYNYYLPQTKTACEFIIHSIKGEAKYAITMLAEAKSDALFKQATLLTMIDAINLIKSSMVDNALSSLKKATLTDSQKDYLLRLLLDYHTAGNVHGLNIDFLHCANLSSRATESYLLLNHQLNFVRLSKFFDSGHTNDILLVEYLNSLFENKNYQKFIELIDKHHAHKIYLKNIKSKRKFLVAMFLSRGIDDFTVHLVNMSTNNNYIDTFDFFFLQQSEVSLDIVYKLIEHTIEKQAYSYTCAEVYKYSLYFYKKNRPGLAKKITTLSVLKRHEDFYTDRNNWTEESDYKMLISAITELNNAVHELSRIGS